MYYFLRFLKRFGKQAGTVVLTGGAMLLIGLLSFTEFYATMPLLVPAGIALFLAAAIEGEVYRNNIAGSLNKLFSPQYLQRRIILDNLQAKLLHKNEVNSTYQDNPFAKAYLDTYQQIALFASIAKKRLLTKQEKAQQKKLFHRMKYLNEYLYGFVLAKPDEIRDPKHYMMDDALRALFSPDDLKKLHNEIRRKIILKHIAQVICIMVGFGSIFNSIFTSTTAFTSISAIFSFTLGSVAMSSLIWPLAGIAAVGYALSIYNTLLDIIHDQKFKRKMQGMFDKLHKIDGESDFQHRFRFFRIGLLITCIGAIGIFATVATAGTWWHAVKYGALLVPYISKIADVIRNITISSLAFATLTFNIKNALESVSEMLGSTFKAPWTQIIDNIRHKREAGESNWQIFNPFRILYKIIYYPYKTVSFLGHLASIGLTGDRLFNDDPTLIQRVCVGLVSATCEGLEDYHYISGGGDEEEDEHHEHDKHEHSHADLELDDAAPKKPKKVHDHDHDHHGHNHDNDIPTLLLNYVLCGWLLCIAAVWDATVVRKTHPDKSTSWGNQFMISLRKQFGKPTPQTDENHEPIEIIQPDVIWQKQECLLVLDKTKKRYEKSAKNDSLDQKKFTMFNTLYEQVKEAEEPIPLAIDAENPHEQHRHFAFFSPEKPRSSKTVEKIRDNYPEIFTNADLR